ncbi:amino acid ABC transporter permease [Limibacillus halophilus]|uniref:Polar amino acid transport system permease protein n=1 Tax=Limibacillus halophilus TaxID=1579333 RepID=A0A839SX01_9PROT|nr:amino acid ABC transporter permease [Limibacillus halophilus]MBB3066210.1 polar amino acid transport system permease protein [Limibacillus halophilus]
MKTPFDHPALRTGGTDLPVLLPAAQRLQQQAERDRLVGGFLPRLTAKHGLWLLAILVLSSGVAAAQSGDARQPAYEVIFKWLPVLLTGFGFNILISFMAMAIGTLVGTSLGLMQISLLLPVRQGSWLVTQFFRNAPWLVLLFYCMFLLPFEFRLGGLVIPFPDWIKATIGLALPVMANVSEIVRGAIASIPSGQWEASESLAFSRRQTLWQIILPQCVKRMLPPWMNLYAILTMATVLASIVGVSEMMTQAGRVLAAEDRPDLLIPIYSFVLLCFFVYCYPIARFTVRLEQRFQVKL